MLLFDAAKYILSIAINLPTFWTKIHSPIETSAFPCIAPVVIWNKIDIEANVSFYFCSDVDLLSTPNEGLLTPGAGNVLAERCVYFRCPPGNVTTSGLRLATQPMNCYHCEGEKTRF